MRKFIKKAKIIDVTVRDGLQSFPKNLSVNQRFSIVNKIAKLGFNDIEVGSLVSDKIIPQMKDSIQVYDLCRKENSKINYHMLVSNKKGINTLMQSNVQNICFFTSPSDSFNKKNINCTVDESFQKIKHMMEHITNDAYTKGYLSCVTECPYDGQVQTSKIVDSVLKLHELGMDEICLSDTLGTVQNERFFDVISKIDNEISGSLSVHLHQTLGKDEWKKVVKTCIENNILSFDTSLLNLGGCPAAFSKENKSGNLDLYDLVNYLDELDVHHDIDKQNIRNIEQEIKIIIDE